MPKAAVLSSVVAISSIEQHCISQSIPQELRPELACVPKLLGMELMAVASNTFEGGHISFTQTLNGSWQPTYGKLLEGEVQRGAPVWQSRRGRAGWFEVDEGWILIPKGEGKGVVTEKDFVQLRKCYKCDKTFHWRAMKVSWETIYADDAAKETQAPLPRPRISSTAASTHASGIRVCLATPRNWECQKRRQKNS